METKLVRRSARPLTTAEVSTWSDEADVVVVGFGVAGAAAAVAAASDGASVLAVERTSGWGGAAAMAGGFIYLGGGTALQKACGFEDSPDDMYAFMKAAFGTATNDEKLAVYAERSVEHFNWLTSCGVPFRAKFFDAPGWEPAADEGLMYSGGENAHPFAEAIRPAPRGHLPQMADKRTGERGGGYMLVKPLVDTALASGVRLRTDSRFERLVIDADGSVCGIVVTTYGEKVAIRARRGVVLASGSFAYNAELVEQHVPALSGRPGSAIEEHDGQAMRAAQWVGADVAHMDNCEVAIHADPGLMARGIVINGIGQRFINEDTYPGRIGVATALQQRNQALIVADQRAVDEATAAPKATRLIPPPSWVSDDIAELEADAGLPSGSLAATLESYNRHAADGSDPLFHKAPQWVRPLDGPIGVFDVRGQTSGFPLGGLRTTVDGAVLNIDGEAIPGLFAAGRTTLGIAASNYASGCSLGDGSFFGRRAGRAAAGA